MRVAEYASVTELENVTELMKALNSAFNGRTHGWQTVNVRPPPMYVRDSNRQAIGRLVFVGSRYVFKGVAQ